MAQILRGRRVGGLPRQAPLRQVWVLGPGHLDVGVVRVSLPRQVGEMPAGGREQAHDVEGHAAADDEHRFRFLRRVARDVVKDKTVSAPTPEEVLRLI